MTPLWTESYSDSEKVEKVVEYIKAENLDQFAGGLPTTKIETGRERERE